MDQQLPVGQPGVAVAVARALTRVVGHSPILARLAWTIVVSCTASAAPRVLSGSVQESFRIQGAARTNQSSVEKTTPCEMPRDELNVSVVAHNPDLYPRQAERIATGWLIYDRYERRIIQTDDQLREVRRWGREAEGPLEYSSPQAFFFLPSERFRVGVIDSRPPSFMWMDADGSGQESRIGSEAWPGHGLFHEGRIVFVGSVRGGVFEMSAYEPQSVRVLASWDDVGLTVVEPEGQPPSGLLRVGGPNREVYLGIQSQSSVWEPATEDDGYRKIVQRCVHPSLTQLHIHGLDLIEGFPPVAINSMQDFLVLPSGRVVTLGGLRLPRDGQVSGRSIESYSLDGTRLGAWLLPMPAFGVFDPSNPHRLLVWDRDIDGAQIVEVSHDERIW